MMRLPHLGAATVGAILLAHCGLFGGDDNHSGAGIGKSGAAGNDQGGTAGSGGAAPGGASGTGGVGGFSAADAAAGSAGTAGGAAGASGVAGSSGAPATGACIWSKGAGDQSTQEGESLALDDQGNLLVTGSLQGALDLGCGPMTSAGSRDVFVAKLAASGACIWSKNFGDASGQVAESIATMGSTDLLLTGYFQGTLDFGCGPLAQTGNAHVFVTKLDSSGGCVWSRSVGNAISQQATAIAADSSGNALLTGVFLGTLDFGCGPLSNSGQQDVFVAKLDAVSGNCVWSKAAGDAELQVGEDVVVDAADNVIVVGELYGEMDLGCGVSKSSGLSDAFLAKLDSSGNCIWSKRAGDADYQYAFGVASDASGNVFVTGDVRSSLDLGCAAIVAPGAGLEDLFVAKLDSAGTCVWSKAWGDGDIQSGREIAVDKWGNLVVTGMVFGTLDLGCGAMTSAGQNDVFVAKLGPSGNCLWTKHAGYTQADLAQGLALDASGNVVVSGQYYGLFDIGCGPLPSSGTTDYFVAKLAP